MNRSESAIVDVLLEEELARGDRAWRSVAPLMSHFLDSRGPSLVSDAIVANVRGFLHHLACQLVTNAGEEQGDAVMHSALVQALTNRLADDAMVMDHLYITALEGLIAQSLEQGHGIDPVLSPLLQELIASDKPAIAELAMSVLAAQSRFGQCLRRMELPIGELAHEVFARTLEIAEIVIDDANVPIDMHALADLKSGYDEGKTRIGLLARLTCGMRGGAIAGLDLAHAGLALFASSCASLLSLEREHAVFACHESQTTRLALMLAAAGLGDEASERQIVLLGGTQSVPGALSGLSQAQALHILAAHLRGSELA